MKDENPREWTFCPVCNLKYLFVNCRITLSTGENLCLTCAVARTKEEVPSPPIYG